MRTTIILAAFTALFASVAVAVGQNETGENGTYDQSYQHFDCGVSVANASHHLYSTIKGLHNSASGIARTGTQKAKVAKRQSSAIVVPTYFHVITRTASAGSITPAMAQAQIDAMNAAYLPSNISFQLLGTSFTVNDAWAVASGADMAAAKASLRRGTYNTLNLYFHTDLAGSILGTCTLPSDIGPGTPAPSSYVSDGCNVQANTMPGGTVLGYNSGKTAVHETGHWLGLLHTFEGYSCTGTGDFINDTPMQSTSTDGCPTKPAKDSCPTVAGVDPIHNYMDYSTDACYTGFTKGQQTRMYDLWTQYRAVR